MGHASPMSDAAARRAFNEELKRMNLRVHSPDDAPLFTREPQSAMQACHWRWQELAPLFERLASELEIGSGGQRRTLRLHNPGLPCGTTHTFWGSIQLILPGEVASAHRHAAVALRFITHGSGAWTTVEGARYPMSEGDLVLTPSWTWHDHEHLGSQPMIWLDVLDISLVRSMHATFFEPYTAEKQPVTAEPDARMSCSMARGLEALHQAGRGVDAHDGLVFDYLDPAGGGMTFPNVGLKLQLLRPGMRGKARRQVASKLYNVVRGEGVSIVGEQRFEWARGDYFVVPPWTWHEHQNRSAGEEAVLFQVSDAPAMAALGYYREETR